ncbi:peptidylprolyl isomerase [Psychroflexus maritimus]|uniref:peptidylprolyl isomerase n=1 Tax=Psychroflexus maritimus TaxID=2714865 RepID=A0A967ADA2_9FLAO|nr:peptidylprolyl isomerase [Psychroflexus maritimus]NGZ90159.1 peptidylprolyl isomerase [Psychroflexus maritimus]
MKKIKLMLLALVAIFVTSCDEYPELEDGLYAKLNTNKGEIIIELHYDQTPMTVGNFVSLAEGNNPKVDEKFEGKNFYDGIIFHRVIKDFMIQTGDPNGNGQGGPGYKFPDEINENLTHNSKGVLSMANAGKDTNGSQFFITLKETPHLDGRHTVFGKVAKGQEVVDQIGQVETAAMDKPKEEVKIERIEIIRKGREAKNFDASNAFTSGIEIVEEQRKTEEEEKAKLFDEMSEGFEETETGLRYKITAENESGNKPVKGQKVAVHYTGMFLDGNKFDSSFDRDEPIEFEVGRGFVIPGWDEGLLLLNEGEKAELLIPANLAYGKAGRGPIPPNTPLFFQVELVKVYENSKKQ